MLTIVGQRPDGSQRFCDGLSRRMFLRVGALGLGAGALTLADVLRAESITGKKQPQKAIINVFLGGGPPHQDMWDLKPNAPAEIRGEFKPIATSVPGIEIGEVFPLVAAQMHKFAVIRSVVGASGRHDAEQCTTGWPQDSLKSVGGRPSIGSVLARLQGPVDPSVPPFVGLAAPTQAMPWSNPGSPGFLGPAYGAFKPDGPGMENMRLGAISAARLRDRRLLLAGFDRLRRDLDARGAMQAKDQFDRDAFDLLASSRLVEALDLSREDPKVLARYGDGKPYQYQYDGAPTVNEHLLLARRLVEVGVRCVTLTFGRWDSHSENFQLVRDHGSKLDQALTALVDDLDERGMLDDVTVIAWGEFGRTPRINKNAGRDHWPQVSCAILAGGGMRTGQVIGSTNRLGEHAQDRPVDFQEIFATLYRNLGINSASTTLRDPSGRPQYLTQREPLRELI
ncbi:MAG TPA: DUF1501 domain-containing protein [Pirellulales bacterium]